LLLLQQQLLLLLLLLLLLYCSTVLLLCAWRVRDHWVLVHTVRERRALLAAAATCCFLMEQQETGANNRANDFATLKTESQTRCLACAPVELLLLLLGAASLLS
jgi:hypothetical protein